MKYPLIFLSLAFITLFSSSCDNDFNINDDWKDITVIYGLLDPAADTNWVRVQRAYLGEAAASASYNQPDSLYYDTAAISVYLEEYNSSSLATPIKTIPLYVSFRGNNQLEPGVFTSDNFRLYYTTETIEQDKTYRLVVKKKNAENPDASSYTEIVGMQQSSSEGFRFVFPSPNLQQAKFFNGRIEWYKSNLAEIYEVDVYFYYKEVNRQTGAIEHLVQKLDYAMLEGVQTVPDNLGKLTIDGQPNDIYLQLANSLPELKPNTLRFFKNFTLVIWAGGEDLAKYISLNKPTEGINNENKPEFPDIENGTGLFSSRTTIEVDDVDMSQQMSTTYYLSSVLCDKGFAIVTSGDTCYCSNIPGVGREPACF